MQGLGGRGRVEVVRLRGRGMTGWRGEEEKDYEDWFGGCWGGEVEWEQEGWRYLRV